MIDPTEAFLGLGAEAPLERIADEQRPGQDGRADQDAEQDGEVASPVIQQVRHQQSDERHGTPTEKKGDAISERWDVHRKAVHHSS